MLPKNIQLSENVEFFAILGDDIYSIVDGKSRHTYIPRARNKNYFGGNIVVMDDTRLLDFYNMIIKKFGLYPLLQKFVSDKEKFKQDYL